MKSNTSINTLYIPERFRRIISVHIVKNMIDVDNWRIPLILGIHGAPGEGKTFMCESVLQELGVKPHLISGGQLESENAGEPAGLLRKTYLDAGEAIQTGKDLMSVILINDFDTGVGNWGAMVQTTINTQQLFAEMMHLTDYSEDVQGKRTLRIPIIITGNNFRSLHIPLVRAGRMWLFEWIPDAQDRVNIVRGIFPTLNESNLQELVLKRFGNQPIAFFSFLKTTLLDDEIWVKVQSEGINNIIRQIRRNGGISSLRIRYDFESLLIAAERISRESLLIDHLGALRGK